MSSDERIVKTYDFQAGFKLESATAKDSKAMNKICFLQDGNNMVCSNDLFVKFYDVQPADEHESLPFQNQLLETIDSKMNGLCDLNC